MKAFANKADIWSSNAGIHMVEGEQTLSYMCPLQRHNMARSYMHTDTQTHNKQV